MDLSGMDDESPPESMEAYDSRQTYVNEGHAFTMPDGGQAVEEDQDYYDQLHLRVNSQRAVLGQQQATIGEQRATIEEQQETINQQQETITQQRETINMQQETLNQQQATIDHQQALNEDQQAAVTQLRAEKDALRRQLREQSQRTPSGSSFPPGSTFPQGQSFTNPSPKLSGGPSRPKPGTLGQQVGRALDALMDMPETVNRIDVVVREQATEFDHLANQVDNLSDNFDKLSQRLGYGKQQG